jgi:hypothetical protein
MEMKLMSTIIYIENNLLWFLFDLLKIMDYKVNQISVIKVKCSQSIIQ